MWQQTDDYVIHSIIKPNANNCELYQEAKCASNDDIIIFWDKTLNGKLLQDLTKTTKLTNLIILTEPYRYAIKDINDIIYKNNVMAVKILHQPNQENITLCECHNILRRSNYYLDRYNLRPRGKWFLCKTILALARDMLKLTQKIVSTKPRSLCEELEAQMHLFIPKTITSTLSRLISGATKVTRFLHINVECLSTKLPILEATLKEHWMNRVQSGVTCIEGYENVGTFCRKAQIHGEVAIYANSKISGNCKEINVRKFCIELDFEIVAVSIDEHLCVACIYRSPDGY
ncbi:hypothetical protein JTB14_023283 [Gonioctena quinquepunctata]|nr:hypothetical protein JTB14_023283 [Gonioctena quinquepunctata]